jgi:hypothetical protein
MDYNKQLELRVLLKKTGCSSIEEYQQLIQYKARPDNSWFRHRGRGGKRGPSPCSVKRNCY